jgi:stage II sporulation protein E
MGVGAEASCSSQSTLGLLELVLGVGLKADQAVRAVNSMMLLRSDKESFATLDLSLIDLRTGSGELFKLGAPPTFLKRKGKASTISLGYPPVGILDCLELSSLKYQFEPGDLIVMVTDGLLDSRFHVAERDVWLCKALEKINNDSPQVIADSLMAQAKANTNLVKDDMAVLVARVYEREVPGLILH